MSKVIVVGGGASGMLAAIGAAECGHSVTIYEKNEKLGKKIYITGKGRCNITNASEMDVLLKNVIRNNKFLYSAFYTYTNDSIVALINEMGVETKIERGNRIFPVSDKSSDVIMALSKRLKELGVDIKYNSIAKSVIVKETTAIGIELENGNKIYADNVIVATGGYSYQTTGSSGDGYRMAKEVGHNVTKIYPSLVPFNAKEEYIKELQGLSLKNVKAAFYCGDKELYSEFGEMLFTHFGVSGPIVLSASSYLTEKISNNEKVTMKIDLKPALSFEALDARVTKDFSSNINKDFRNSLNDLLPKKLIPVIINLSGIDEFKKVHDITREERHKLVLLLKCLEVTITSTRGFNEAIITRGGIEVKEINSSTMESKIIKHLFFTGEVLDLDALTGGYNLQIAYSTGYLAGISVY